MTNALINQEHGLYSARGVRADTVWRPWQVEKKIRETADVVTFVVKRIDDRLVKTSLPASTSPSRCSCRREQRLLEPANRVPQEHQLERQGAESRLLDLRSRL